MKETHTTDFKRNLQRDFVKLRADPEAFVTLPKFLIDEIGTHSNRGVRLELAVLAGFAHHYKRNRQNSQLSFPIYGQGAPKLRIQEGQFIVSIWTIAEDLYARWCGNPYGSLLFKRFYERVRKATERLITKGYLKRIGHLEPAKKGVTGTVWTFQGTPIEGVIHSCSQCARNATSNDPRFVNVVDLIGDLFDCYKDD